MGRRLWFDVGKERYTTFMVTLQLVLALWFDVGKERYTTLHSGIVGRFMLWFDVGKERYTTDMRLLTDTTGCGLM